MFMTPCHVLTSIQVRFALWWSIFLAGRNWDFTYFSSLSIYAIFGCESYAVNVRGTYMYINISLWCDRWSDHWSVLRRLSRIRDEVPPKTLPGYSSFVSSSSSVSSPLLSSLLATAAWTAGISSYFDRRLVLWPEIWFSLKPYENILHFLTQSIIIIIVLAVIITWWWSP